MSESIGEMFLSVFMANVEQSRNQPQLAQLVHPVKREASWLDKLPIFH